MCPSTALQSTALRTSSARREAFEELKERLRPTALPPRGPKLGSGVPDLDRALLGGLPQGILAILEGAAGRWSIAARLLARATRRSLAAVIDAGALYPPDLAAAGVALERLIVVPAGTPIAIARAVDAVVRSRACSVIVFDAPPLHSPRVQCAAPLKWARLSNLAHKYGTLLLVVAERASWELAAAAGVRLYCDRNSRDCVHVSLRNKSIPIPCSQ
jgi:hypothetical protein